jgi:hypothetical protein
MFCTRCSRLIGIGTATGISSAVIGGLVGVAPGITEAITANAGSRRLALLHRIVPAAGHVTGNVLPAKLAGACVGWRKHRAERDRRHKSRGRRCSCSQKLFHHLARFVLCCRQPRTGTWDARDHRARLINRF